MELDHSSVPKLAALSRRLSIGLICIFGLAMLLVATSYWALNRVIQEEQNKVHFHFMRLIGDIQEHQGFLTRIARQSDPATQRRDQDVVPLQRRVVAHREGLELHEGREFSFAMPFTLAVPERPLDIAQSHGAFSFGVMLANFYSHFWSTSSYPSPQTLILDLKGDTTLAVPAIGSNPAPDAISWDRYSEVIERIRKRLRERPPLNSDIEVRWGRGDDFVEGREALLSYVLVDLPDPLWWEGQADRQVVAVTLLDLARIKDYEQIMDRRIFKTLELISPDGERLLGEGTAHADFDEGINFTVDGVVIKASSTPDNGWVALYQIDYQDFFRYARWQLLGIAVVILGALVAGWLATRWYARRVIGPADDAHRKVVESDAFSRAVIQTAPVALCVIRRSDLQVVLHNASAAAWFGEPEQISNLARDWQLFADGTPASGACIRVDDRYLHVVFAPTRYRGEEVMLGVFNDISTHKEVASTLAEAKRAADAANEAKTAFLASMSHEIRTPLYGVLGTLELLGLTRLDAQQRGYLDTISGSSATLLQLISDILDVTRIEAGEMALEPVEFSPLELTEELLRAYAGTAAGKQLQLYSCVEPEVPARVQGDAARIRQILGNLLSNALKFTEIGRVVLRLKVVGREAGHVELHWQVADTGIGIARELQGRLFERFFQVRGSLQPGGGAGLGLSICSQLCQLMGGSLQMVSERGLGSSFSLVLRLQDLAPGEPALSDLRLMSKPVFLRAPVRELSEAVGRWLQSWGAVVVDYERRTTEPRSGDVLLELLPESLIALTWQGMRVAGGGGQLQPHYSDGAWRVSLHNLRGIGQALLLAQQGATLAPAIAESGEQPGRLGLRVLVAEDNPVNQVLLVEQLEALGCLPCMVADGQEALARFDAAEFDLVITDLNMPNLDGYQLTRALREGGATLPIIGVTANALSDEVQRGRAVGMDAWLVKPMSLATLHGCLSRVTEGMVPAADHTAAPATQPPATEESPLVVPARMRQLFINTMGGDLEGARQALHQGDIQEVRQRVHRMRGALAVVAADELEVACGEAEDALLVEPLGASLERRVSTLLERIEAALRRLEP